YWIACTLKRSMKTESAPEKRKHPQNLSVPTRRPARKPCIPTAQREHTSECAVRRSRMAIQKVSSPGLEVFATEMIRVTKYQSIVVSVLLSLTQLILMAAQQIGPQESG